MTNGVRNKLTPFYLKFFAARTITECEYQAIKLADHTQYSTAGTQAKSEGYNLFPQFPVAKAGQGGGTGEADLAIGWFGLADIPQTPQALCEFKDDRSGLDAAQNRKGNDRSRVNTLLSHIGGRLSWCSV